MRIPSAYNPVTYKAPVESRKLVEEDEKTVPSLRKRVSTSVPVIVTTQLGDTAAAVASALT